MIIIFFTSCSDKKIDYLNDKLLECKEIESIFNYVLLSSNSTQFTGNINYDSLTNALKSNQFQMSCWEDLNITKIEFAYQNGIESGCLFYTSTGTIIFYTKKEYWLSPRYKLKRKTANNIYLLEYVG